MDLLLDLLVVVRKEVLRKYQKILRCAVAIGCEGGSVVLEKVVVEGLGNA
jgi:hypothetical protein